ncbi:MAG TPA: 3-isopropylmalate dehydratase large subunit, partial [Desulfobacteraceae bacterium]|nr:3-isopropylmalate dehydratase large subunit [Desulfobacteraceae bacterium]
EFAGEGIRYLSMADRFTMANMAVEAGAKNGIFEPDNITIEYLKDRIDVPYKVLNSDRDAQYEKVIDIDLNSIEPQIALPHSPDNVAPVSEVKDVKIDQVFIGSCTNGRIEDLRVASQVLKGKRVLKGLRLIIIPGSQQIYKKALSEGLLDIFINAGAIICPPTCGPCLGGHMGLLAKGEVCLSTSNRNFRGRMGHPESEIYLCGPAVAAASSITGKITSPEEL